MKSINAVLMGLMMVSTNAFAAEQFACKGNVKGTQETITVQLNSKNQIELVNYFPNDTLKLAHNAKNDTQDYYAFSGQFGCVPTAQNPAPRCFAIMQIDIQVEKQLFIKPAPLAGLIKDFNSTLVCTPVQTPVED